MKKMNIQYFLKAYLDGTIRYDFAIDKTKLLVGSAEICDIRIDDSSISHYHAVIHLKDSGIEIQDLQSLNGVLINDNPVTSGFISSEDVLQIGAIPFILEESETLKKKIEISDDDGDVVKTTFQPQQVGLKPVEGLTVIDDEYCDIIFENSDAKQTNLDTSEIASKYVDFNDDQELEDKDILNFCQNQYFEVELSAAGHIIDTQYLSAKNKTYAISNAHQSNSCFCFRELSINDKQSLLTFDGTKMNIHDLPGYEIREEESCFYLTNQDLQIKISLVKNIPPFFEFDHYLQKINAKTMGSVMSVFLLLLLIDTSLPEKPKKVAIIYKLQKPVAKKMKADDPVNNNSNPGQNTADAPPKQSIAKQSPSKKKKINKKRKVVKKIAKAAKPVVKKKVTPIKTYKFKSNRSLSAFFKNKNKIKIKTVSNKNSTSKSVTTASSQSSPNVNYKGIGKIRSRNPGSVSRAGNLNSLGGRGLISKEGVDTSFATTKTVVLGSMDPELLRKILREYLPQFRQCYQQELVKHSNKIEGVIALDFRIGKAGKVVNSNIRIQKSKFSKNGSHCMNRVLSLIKFPKPRGGGFVDVTQPLNFYAEREVIN